MATSATYQVTPPEPFTFTRPGEWPRWIRRFERFRAAAGLTEKPEPVQVNTLLYSMGDEADDILRSFTLSEDDQKKYSVVKQRFDGHFVKKHNVIFERAKFNMRKQEEGEPVDAFITDLYALAEHCGYGTLHDQMIRDRLVVGLRSAGLSEKLQLDPELTLEKAVAQVRQTEAIKLQQTVIRGERAGKHDTPVGSVDKEKRGHRPRHVNRFRQSNSTPTSTTQSHSHSTTACFRCGMTPTHDRAHCPAREAVCRKCGKRGHYQKVCRSQAKVGAVSEITESAFLGVVGEQGKTPNNPWVATVQLNGRPTRFQIDTGAEVTVIPKSMYKKLHGVSLQPSQRTLRGPSQNVIPVKGQFMGTLKLGNQAVEQEVYVVSKLFKPLLGRPAIEALGLLLRIGAVETDKSPVQRFPQLFQGLGKMQEEYTIKLREGAKPFALTTPRRVAIPLMDKVKEELTHMEKLGVISRVEEPTDWCAGMVVVPKSSGKVRICVDLTKLNENVRRERHPLPAVEQTLAQITGARVFSKLDANSGFWQIPLSSDSALLTTFITPFGRYCFDRLPFGITSAPEHFQRRMSAVLHDLEGVVCLMDDILVHGRTQEEHDQRLDAVLQRLRDSGITLNKEKCSFSQRQVKFLGQVLTPSGVSSDPDKVSAVQKMREPTSVSEVRRFLGMANQLSKFTPNLANMTQPLRDLLSKKNQWSWDAPQKEAFSRVKEALTKSPVLSLFDPSLETIVSADASSYGLGAVLLQKQSKGEIRAVAYISRAMTQTEQRYAQIEKEALALTWACERFEDYLVGLHFHIETDHKPLVPLFSTKLLDELPLRVQRFRMRMMRFSFSISHVAGKNLSTADALSRAPISDPTATDHLFREEVDAYVQAAIQNLPATERRLEEIQAHQERDEVCKQIVTYCQEGWPDKPDLPERVKPFYPVSAELSVQEGLLMRGNRLVIPTDLRAQVLTQLHASHQGITKCRERARQSVWWPGLSSELEEIVKKCPKCIKYQSPRAEPLMPSSLPSLPWQKVATDLFEWKKSSYLLIVDYFSRWIEIAKLEQMTSNCVISHTQSIFARYGIPETVVSDNGPQYSSEAFACFAREYGFEHVTSSPYYPQANGEAERAVQTVKNLLKKAQDPYLALLAYRSTPLSVGYTPSELLMCRKLRTTVPMTRGLREPKVPDYSVVAERDETEKEKQKVNFDSHHGARELPTLLPGDCVYVKDRDTTGTVLEESAPRSYLVQTPDGTVRRNRRHVVPSPSDTGTNATSEPSNESDRLQDNSSERVQINQPKLYPTRSRSGRIPQPPSRLDNSWD